MASAPAIIVLDSSGLSHSDAQLISTLRSAIPDAKLIMVDMDADDLAFLRAIRDGVVGYVLKDASAIELVSTAKLKNSQPSPQVPFCFSPHPTDCCIVRGLNTIYILQPLHLD